MGARLRCRSAARARRPPQACASPNLFLIGCADALFLIPKHLNSTHSHSLSSLFSLLSSLFSLLSLSLLWHHTNLTAFSELVVAESGAVAFWLFSAGLCFTSPTCIRLRSNLLLLRLRLFSGKFLTPIFLPLLVSFQLFVFDF